MPSSDPKQQQLRDRKKSWNKKIRDFTNDLISIKKVMNGAPSKFHNEVSKIQDPIPSDPASVLGVLASDFNEIVNEGNAIITQQIDYAKTRRQKQNAPNPNQMSFNFAADDKVAEGSNKLTRFFSRFKGPVFFGPESEREKRILRLNMLQICVELEEAFKELQEVILSSTEDSILTADKLIMSIEKNVLVLRKYVMNAQPPETVETAEQLEPSVPEKIDVNQRVSKEDNTPPFKFPDPAPESEHSVAKEPIVPVVNEGPSISSIINDIDLNKDNFSYDPMIYGLYLEEKKKLKKGGKDKEAAIVNIQALYREILKALNAASNTNESSINDILIKKQAFAKQELVKLAYDMELFSHAFAGKWLKRQLLKLKTRDKTSGIRLKIDEKARICKSISNAMMDSLEKDIEPVYLDKASSSLLENILEMKSTIRLINKSPTNQFLDPRFMDLVHKQIDEKSYSKEQADKLKNNLNRQSVTEIAKGYK